MPAAVRLRWRRLARHWLTSVVIVLTLGLTGGAAGGAATVLRALTWRALDVERPERLVSVTLRRGDALLGFPPGVVEALAASTETVANLCGYTRGATIVTDQGREFRRSVEGFSAGCADVLGARISEGRWLTAADEPPGGTPAPVVVVSDTLRRMVFGEGIAAVGRTLRVAAVDLTVVGVMPPALHGFHVDQGADLVVPRDLMPSLVGLTGPLPALYALGRLAPGVTLTAADADIRTRWPAVWAASAPPPRPGTPASPAAHPSALDVQPAGLGLSDLRAQYAQPARLFVALSAGVLLMAAISVAGVLTARASARKAEFGLAGALGARRAHVLWDEVADVTVLGVVAGGVAAAVAHTATRQVAHAIWTAALPLALPLTPSAPALAAIGIATVGLTVGLALPGLAVALRAWASGPRLSAGRVTADSGRNVGIALQTAGATALVFAALAFGRNVRDLYAIAPGYDLAGLSWTTLERLPGAPPPGDPGVYATALLAEVQGLPGVAGAALSASFPLMPVRARTALIPAAHPDGIETLVAQARVAPGFFQALGVPLLSGEDLADTQRRDGPADAVLNRRAALRIYGDTAIGGRSLSLGGRSFRVAGVVADFSPGDIRLADLPVVFTSMLREPALLRSPVLVVRGTPGAVVGQQAVADAVRAVGRHVSGPVRPVQDHLNGQLARERVAFGLALMLAAAAVAVAAAGLYARLVHASTTRRRDVAVRLALGASRRRAVWAVVAPTAVAVAAGLAAGLPLAWAIERAARPMFHGGHAFTAALVTGTLAIFGFGATIAALAPVVAVWRLAPARWLNQT